jgi:gas vesicle protein
VSKNIIPVQGHIHSYYTSSQSRSQNGTPTPPGVVAEMIQSTIQLKEQEHKQEIEELLAKQKEEHKQQLDALTAAITEQFTQQMVAQLADQAALYEEQFRSLEGYRVVISKPEVTIVGSPARIIPRSSVDSTQGNNILHFIIS